jgi:hypothetical protein
MNAPACLAQWPQTVSRQVMAALFMPAGDLHPEQARRLVPRALWTLPAAEVSRGLEPRLGQWPEELDGRRLEHRLALLPRSVLDAIAWNLGLLKGAANLRKRVLRSELQVLAENGLTEADWHWVHEAPRQSWPALELPEGDCSQWPQRLRQSGVRALLALTAPLGDILGTRLAWKLPPDETAAEQAPPTAMLHFAYTPVVQRWSAHWDDCLAQLSDRSR